LLAIDRDTTVKIYTKILTSLFPSQKQITVYVPNKEYNDILKYSTKLKVVNNITKASIAIVTNTKELKQVKKLKKNIIIFTNNEKILFLDNEVIGAFYWKKGRSQLLFVKDRLDKYHIKLSSEYNKFIIKL
jgi:hypothetical protein